MSFIVKTDVRMRGVASAYWYRKIKPKCLGKLLWISTQETDWKIGWQIQRSYCPYHAGLDYCRSWQAYLPLYQTLWWPFLMVILWYRVNVCMYVLHTKISCSLWISRLLTSGVCGAREAPRCVCRLKQHPSKIALVWDANHPPLSCVLAEWIFPVWTQFRQSKVHSW